MAKNIDPPIEEQAPAPPAERFSRQGLLMIGGSIAGVLIVLGLGVLLGRIIYHSSPTTSQTAHTAASGGDGQGEASIPFGTHLSLPDGAAVRSMALSGSQLAVHYDAPDGGGIVIINLATGRTVGRLRTDAAGTGRRWVATQTPCTQISLIGRAASPIAHVFFPCAPAPLLYWPWTPASHVGNRGSSPLRGANSAISY